MVCVCVYVREREKEFHMTAGDCVIQNGGNSGVGLSVSQLAEAWNLHCISIVRDR